MSDQSTKTLKIAQSPLEFACNELKLIETGSPEFQAALQGYKVRLENFITNLPPGVTSMLDAPDLERVKQSALNRALFSLTKLAQIHGVSLEDLVNDRIWVENGKLEIMIDNGNIDSVEWRLSEMSIEELRATVIPHQVIDIMSSDSPGLLATLNTNPAYLDEFRAKLLTLAAQYGVQIVFTHKPVESLENKGDQPNALVTE